MSVTSFISNFLLGYTALTVALYMISFVVPRAAFVARSLATYASGCLASFIGAVVSIIFTLLGYQQIAQWFVARIFKYIMLATTGVTFEIDDPNDYLSKTRPAIFIANHQTELDVLLLGCMFPKYCSVTAKSSLKNVPFLGWFMRASGTIFIDRKNSKDAREAMKGAADEIQKKKQSVFMFPEGTRSYAKEPGLLPFKKGAFHLAVQAGVPIVPVVVSNYSHILFVKGLVFRSGSIPVKILEPISTKGLTAADVEELTRATRDSMLNEITTLTAKARGQPIAVPASSKPSASSTAIDP
ncbi:acyltransferase-domain-containing protein [Sarocladium strictum]